MRCSKVRKKVFLYLEDMLPKEEKNKIKEHLKTCAWCASEYKKTEKMMGAFTSGSPKVLPENLHKNIMIEIKGQKAFNEEEKRENIMAMHKAIRRAGVVFASVFVVFFTLQFIDFETLKDKGFKGIAELNKVANDVIEESKLENSTTSADALNAMFDNAASKQEIENNEDEIKIDTNDKKEESLAEQIVTEESDENEDKNKEGIDYETFLEDFSEEFLFNNVVKESILEIYTPNFDETLNQIKSIVSKNSGNIYYQNITHDDKSEEKYRVSIMALKINKDKFDTVKSQIEKLGYYEVNIEKEKQENQGEDLSQLLLQCKNQKLDLIEKLENSSDEEEKERIRIEMEGVDTSISNLEKQLAQESNVEEVVNLEVTLKECSELDIEGIISKETYINSIKKSFAKGYEKFIRLLQDSFLWICENIMFIVVYIILFIIVYLGFKTLFLRDKE